MKKNFLALIIILVMSFSITACDDTYQANEESLPIEREHQTEEPTQEIETQESETEEPEITNEPETTDEADISKTEEKPVTAEKSQQTTSFEGYKIIEVDGGDLSGYREPNVAVDIGFGDRQYWAFTNEYGQLVKVIADEIILQDDDSEPVTSDGRYYNDEAKVPGVESDKLDEGHIIADSLGGVSNAYNITPQNSTLNRHGDQAYMEKVIRDAGGCSDFEAIITYSNTETQIPSKYKYTYTLMGNVIVDEFENINPDEYNETSGITEGKTNTSQNNEEHDISSIDLNGNGQISIKEAKSAGFKMPITRDHWLYQYMTDADGDGMVGE
jgi:hypothetical protein